MLTPEVTEIISKGFHDIFIELCISGKPFGVIVQNHNDWDKPLPDRLLQNTQFMFKIENDTLEDLKLNETDGDFSVTITADFDNEMFVKTFSHEDIAGFFTTKDMKPFMLKPFALKPVAVLKQGREKYGFKIEDVKDEDLIDSMNAFKKNNPEMFEEK